MEFVPHAPKVILDACVLIRVRLLVLKRGAKGKMVIVKNALFLLQVPTVIVADIASIVIVTLLAFVGNVNHFGMTKDVIRNVQKIA